MNMNNLPGIDVLGGFRVRSSQPLDVRQTVDTIQDRNSLVSDNQAFVGLRVFVTAVKKSYIYNGESWDEIPTAISVAQAMEVFTAPDINEATDGAKGLVPAPTVNDDGKYLTTAGWTSIPTASETSSGFMTSAMLGKLNGMEVGANNYTHPTTHDAIMITEDSSHRFATDNEKQKWNNKTEVLIGDTPSSDMPANSIFGKILRTATDGPTVPPTPSITPDPTPIPGGNESGGEDETESG